MNRLVLVCMAACAALGCVGDATQTEADTATGSEGAGDGDGDPSTGDGDPSTGDGDPGCVPLAVEITPELADLTLATADGKSLAATIARPGAATCRPGLVLIHQYNLDRSQWAEQIPSFVAAGYVVLSFDLRGHGDSDPQDGALADILDDPDQAPLDVSAALSALANDAAVDPERIGIVGTSVGANLAVVGMHQHPEVVVAVPISARMDPILALANDPAALELGSLSCFAGELDAGGQAETCAALVDIAGPDAELHILPGSSEHGVEIVDNHPETIPTILAWLEPRL